MDKSMEFKNIFYMEVYKEGKLIDVYEDKNKVVAVGLESVLQLLGNSETVANKAITQIGFGTSNSQPLLSDTGLTDAYIKAIDAVSFPSQLELKIDWSLATSEANGKLISEYGLFHADGVLFARKVRATIDKQSDLSFVGSWTIKL